ncbi:putative calcium-dependent protein kinase [Corchorus olitorius]|uniref:Calcium-dependent protein kinase n=1 Tax=Corchorus olitorius TaxID=93759 RepID=A0A1R3L1X0_9ROSI|nr:putative calcium-dependent protein kinase [Corchorus olitorius]
MGSLADRKMYFEEFCAAAIHILHLEADEGWKHIVSTAFEHFKQEGNRVISNEEFCKELCITRPSALSSVHDCIRDSDGKLNLFGFIKLLGGSIRRFEK